MDKKQQKIPITVPKTDHEKRLLFLDEIRVFNYIRKCKRCNQKFACDSPNEDTCIICHYKFRLGNERMVKFLEMQNAK